MSCPVAPVAVKRLRLLGLEQEAKSRHANTVFRPLSHAMSLRKIAFFGIVRYCFNGSVKGHFSKTPTSCRSFRMRVMIRSRIRWRRMKTMAIPKQAPLGDFRR